ncbi:ATP-binding protein [Neobacillus mesonae]|nr:ATP-binding protein [Neobacillus mesonae]
MFAVKDILLQLLLAGITPLLFSLFLGRIRSQIYEANKPPAPISIERNLMLACMISIVLCFTFSTIILDSLYLNLSMLPATVAILYGSYPAGIFVSVSSILLFVVSTEHWNALPIILQSGILLYPIMLLLTKRFKHSGLDGKRRMFFVSIIICFIASMGITFLSLAPREAYIQLDFIIYSLIYSISALLIGLAVIHVVEQQLIQLGLATERQSKQLEYRQHFQMNEQLLNTIPVSVVAFDVDGKIVNANLRMLTELQKKNPSIEYETEMIGKHIEFIIGQEHGSRVTERIRFAASSGKISSEYLRVGPYTFHTTISPIKDPLDGRLIGTSLILQDITELENLRNELAHVERLSLVGQMAASITHEVRNPMAVVRGFLQLMHEKSPRSLDHYYRIVMEELDRANGIINDFLSLAQNRIVEKEEVHLHDVIQDLLPLLWADANMRGQTIKLNLSENLPKCHLNPKEMKQLILNLARNGMEAMDSKGTLFIETSVTENQINLKVMDEGPGIPASAQEKLFEPFYTTKSKGTGLGLALCLGIAERHNATICVESEEGRGTAFTVIFNYK